MSLPGPSFYDDDDVFKIYLASRARPDNPNDTLEKPVLLQLLGDLTGKRILDLGCGDVTFGREAFQQGCAAYLGVEGSQNMVVLARQNLGRQVVKYHHTVEDYCLGLQRAGFVIESVREAHPQPKYFADEETYRRRMRIPLFLLLAGKKP